MTDGMLQNIRNSKWRTGEHKQYLLNKECYTAGLDYHRPLPFELQVLPE